jgi:hypothetical protein
VTASGSSVSWGEFSVQAPQLARFGADRLTVSPAYLATVRPSGAPRVHPVTPIVTPRGVFLFMEPTSPKGRDLRDRRRFALHNGVPDDAGSGGEFYVAGVGVPVDDPSVRAEVEEAATYPPAERYVLFELLVSEARCNGYGDIDLPDPTRWSAG